MFPSVSASSASHGSLNLDIRFDRPDKTYSEEDTVSGSVVISTKSETKFDSLSVEMEGAVRIHTSGKALGVIEALSNQNIKTIILTNWSKELAKSGTIQSGKTEYPFQFVLAPNSNRTIYETYHGVYLAIQYGLKCEMKRSFGQKSLQKAQEFVVVQKQIANETPNFDSKPVSFVLTPESIRSRDLMRSSGPRLSLPKFHISGRFESSVYQISSPIRGEVTIHKCDIPLKSVDIQLLRAETCGSQAVDAAKTEVTEIQTLQIADGDVTRDLSIPIHMVLPRLFACSSLETPNFRIAFQLAVVFLFNTGHQIKEVFPITLVR